MDKTTQSGRFLFAISMAAFGIEQFIISDFYPELLQIPSWVPGRLFLVYFTGIALFAAGASIITNQKARLPAISLGVFWFVSATLLPIPRVVADLSNGGEWTTAFESLAIGGAALVLAGTLPTEQPYPQGQDSREARALRSSAVVRGFSRAGGV